VIEPRAVDEDFEIPLRRPYAPIAIVLALVAPLAAWVLLYPTRALRHANLRQRVVAGLLSDPLRHYAVAAGLVGAVVFLSLVLLCIARHPRWSLRATRDALELPRRMPLFSTAPMRLPWRDVLVVHLGFHLIVKTRASTHRVPAYWFRSREQMHDVHHALDERLRREREKLGAALAR
jgi:hypothetical protein